MAKRILAFFIIAVCIVTTFAFINVDLGALVIRTPGIVADVLSNAPDGTPYSLEKVNDEIVSDVATVFGVGAVSTIAKLGANGGNLKRIECHSTLEKGIYLFQALLRNINNQYPTIPYDSFSGITLKNSFSLFIDETLPYWSETNGIIYIEFYSPPKYSGFNVSPWPVYAPWIWKDSFWYRWTFDYNHDIAHPDSYFSEFHIMEGNTELNSSQPVWYNIGHYAPYIISQWDWNKQDVSVHIYSTDPTDEFYISVNGSRILVTGDGYTIDEFFNGKVVDLGIRYK